jgi:hypothetical protein
MKAEEAHIMTTTGRKTYRTDPAVALCSAREDASAVIPHGIHGSFDDVELTFRLEGGEV